MVRNIITFSTLLVTIVFVLKRQVFGSDRLNLQNVRIWNIRNLVYKCLTAYYIVTHWLIYIHYKHVVDHETKYSYIWYVLSCHLSSLFLLFITVITLFISNIKICKQIIFFLSLWRWLVFLSKCTKVILEQGDFWSIQIFLVTPYIF